MLAQAISLENIFANNPKQQMAWEQSCKHRFVLYGGAAGGGKSFFLRWWCVGYLYMLHAMGIDKANVLLACESYPALVDRQITKIQTEFPLELGELRRGTTTDFVLSRDLGSGSILLRNLDDPAKYLSAEFAGVAIDELTRNDSRVFDFVRSRLRWPGVARPRFVSGTNPGGIGHAWVRKLWIDRDFPKELDALKNEFAFVPAKASDNPHLSKSYYDDLGTLPSDMAKAYAEGSWDIFAGQYFDNFSEDKHTHKQGEIELKPWWPRWISGDWGFKHPGCIHWHAQDGDKTITYRELYGAGMSERECGEAIVKLSAGENIRAFFYSPDAFAQRTSQNTIAEEIGEVLREASLPFPTQADNDRIGGWRLMHQLLDAGLWTINRDTCPNLVKCLPTLIRNDKTPGKIEDILKVDHTANTIGDDPADSARYGLKTKYGEAQVPVEVRVQSRLKELRKTVDMSQVMLQRDRIIREERKTTVHPIKLRRPTRWARN